MMGNIKEAIWQLLQSTLTNESICGLGSFAVGGGSLPTGNLYEITANDVEATVNNMERLLFLHTIQQSEKGYGSAI